MNEQALKEKIQEFYNKLPPDWHEPWLADRLVPIFFASVAKTYARYRPNTSFFRIIELRAAETTTLKGTAGFAENLFKDLDANKIVELVGEKFGADLAELVPAGGIGIDEDIGQEFMYLPAQEDRPAEVQVILTINIVEMGRPNAPALPSLDGPELVIETPAKEKDHGV